MVLLKMIDQPLRKSLIDWYDKEKRDLPWRRTNDPWLILLSEVILQQTQVSRGIEYWEKISNRFPTPKSLSKADQEELLTLWQGAGYYARARRLHALAVQVSKPVKEGGFDGSIPESIEQLLELPGIGAYTAAAVASIAFDLPVGVVDGNVRRVASRQTGNSSPTHDSVGMWANSMLISGRPGDSNQAMMELGAVICKPKAPKCDLCPIANSCVGKENPLAYPTPIKRKKSIENLDAAVLLDSVGRPRLFRRDPSERFGGMWGPPMRDIMTDSLTPVGEIVHHLTHRELRVKVWSGQCSKGIDPTTVPISNLDRKILEIAGAM